MGYAVYITRARRYPEGAQVPIPQEDWCALIENDPDLEATAGRPDLATWAGPTSVEDPTIEWANGNLFSLDPDHSVVRKLVDIAGLLGGRVQGEDGELYTIERGRVVREDSAEEPPVDRSSPAEPFQGVGSIPSSMDEGMAEEELEAALGALATHGAGVVETPADVGPEDPNASFARPPEEALELDRTGGGDPMPFKVGQRVRTSWGRPGTIVSIDTDADWGMGSIEIKYDDGRTATTSCVAHGLKPL